MSIHSPHQSRVERWSRQFTLIVSNVIKLGGLFIVVRAVLENSLQPELFLLAAFMMSGAQLTEGTVMTMIDHFLGRPEHRHEELPPHSKDTDEQ